MKKMNVLLMAAIMAASTLRGGELKTPSLIVLPGGSFEKDNAGAKTGPREQSLQRRGRGEQNVMRKKVDFPVRGVWYVWIKASAEGAWPAILTYSLDGKQPLHSARKEVLIQPQEKAAWHSFSRFPNFRIEVNVDEPGVHELEFTQAHGNPSIEKIMLTLFFSAKLKGDTLDMSGDPGQGWAEKPLKAMEADGFRKDRKSRVPTGGRILKVENTEALAAVNQRSFGPGDVILLKRGVTFKQGLSPKGSGSVKRPIVLGAYGTGERPVVNGQNQPGLHLKDQSYWQVQDLAFTCDPEYRKDAVCLEVSEKAPRSKGVKVENCLAYDSGRHGINIGGHAGYDGAVVENCLSFCNSNDGIVIHGATQKSCRNSVVRQCTVYSNPGMAGIWIEGGENGLIEDCLAYNNSCVNIWSWNAINITMRRCEAFRGRPQRDAAGFDIDWGSEACTLEYCYSHHNEGDSVLLMGSGNADFLGYTMQSNYNLMRFCVAEGHTDAGETFNHCKVYNNLMVGRGKDSNVFTIFGWPNQPDGGKGRDGGWPEDTHFRNNIILALDGATAMYIDDYGTTQGNSWDHNLYWKPGKSKAPLIRWGGRKSGPGFWQGDRNTGTYPPKDYADLKSFQKATGQEAGGMEADPRLAGLPGGYGRLPQSGSRLKAGSPALGAGTAVKLDQAWLKARRKHLSETGAEAYGIPMDPAEPREDYWGDKLDQVIKSIGPQR